MCLHLRASLHGRKPASLLWCRGFATQKHCVAIFACTVFSFLWSHPPNPVFLCISLQDKKITLPPKFLRCINTFAQGEKNNTQAPHRGHFVQTAVKINRAPLFAPFRVPAPHAVWDGGVALSWQPWERNKQEPGRRWVFVGRLERSIKVFILCQDVSVFAKRSDDETDMQLATYDDLNIIQTNHKYEEKKTNVTFVVCLLV